MSRLFPNQSESILGSNDRQLWAACQQGNKLAFEQLYTIYFNRLAGYGRKLTPDVQLLEDAIQDVFIDLWRRKAYLADIENLKFYLFRALRNQLIRNSRHDVFESAQDVDDFLDLLVTLSSEHQSIEQETKTHQVQEVQKAIAQLTKRQQEAIHLRFYQGLSLDEITDLMSLNKQSVSNLLFKAYAILRASIKATPVVWLSIFPYGF